MKMVRNLALALCVALPLCAALPLPQLPRPEGVQVKYIHAGKLTHGFALFIPPKAEKESPLPLIVAIHAANGAGIDQIGGWGEFADANNIMLLCPDIGPFSYDWDQLYDHPEWLRSAVDELRKLHPIDGRRMYLFGDSAGGMFAFYFAFVESNYFAAAAVHGAVIKNFKFDVTDLATRKIPIAYYIGTRDGWWTLAQSRSVRDAITTRGFPLHYVELKGADHNFFAHKADVIGDAWEFMSQYSLESEPKFESLDLAKIKKATH